MCLNRGIMPPQNQQPYDPGSLPTPQAPQGPPPQGVPQQPAAPMPTATAPQAQIPAPAPEEPIGVPKLHPENIQQAYPAPEADQQQSAGRYDFFMEAKPKEQKSLLPKKGNKFAWIIIGAIGFFVLLGGAAAVLSSMRSSQSENNTETLMSVVQQQQEIIRLNKDAVKNVTETDLANFVATSTVTATSSQLELISFMSKHGVKVDTAALAKYQADPNHDKVLKSAQAASVYDTTYRRLMLELMNEYQSSLEGIAAKATLKSEKDIVEKNLQGAELLRNILVVPQT